MCVFVFVFVQLTIRAQDLGNPPRSSVKTITIALENIDDNMPVFNEVQAIKTTLIRLLLKLRALEIFIFSNIR